MITPASKIVGAVAWGFAAFMEIGASAGWIETSVTPHWVLAGVFVLLAAMPWVWREDR